MGQAPTHREYFWLSVTFVCVVAGCAIIVAGVFFNGAAWAEVLGIVLFVVGLLVPIPALREKDPTRRL